MAHLDDHVLVGDSSGAVVALATGRPAGLRALVLSGGFAANPVITLIGRARIRAARFLPGPLYCPLVHSMHAAAGFQGRWFPTTVRVEKAPSVGALP